MCGRYVFDADGEVIAYVYGVPKSRLHGDIERHYNVAPTMNVPVVRRDDEGRRVDLLRWGLIPWWAKDEKIGAKLINARGETLAEKPAFREAFRKRRCLIPASGFYEWEKLPASTAKQPHYVSVLAGKLMTFAGLWEWWRSPDGRDVQTYTIVTTAANDLVATLHDRMPVMLHEQAWDTWLDPRAERDVLQTLIRPYPAQDMRYWPVSRRVNKAAEDAPELIEPLVE